MGYVPNIARIIQHTSETKTTYGISVCVLSFLIHSASFVRNTCALLIIAPGSSDWGESLPARDGEVQLTPVASQPWIFLSHGWPAIPWSHNFIRRFPEHLLIWKHSFHRKIPHLLWKIISAWTLDRVRLGKPELVSKSSNILTYQDIFLDFSYEAFGTLISPEGLNAISIELLKLSKIHVAIVSDGRTLGMEQNS